MYKTARLVVAMNETEPWGVQVRQNAVVMQ